MKIEYILILKNATNIEKINIKSRIKNSLKYCFQNITDDVFEIQYKATIYKIKYSLRAKKIAADNNILCYLCVYYGRSNNEKTASILDLVHSNLIKNINAGKSKFHIIISYDERSLYFSARAYPYFSTFESKLRCIILKSLTQNFGMQWAEETLTTEQKNMLKEKLKSGNYEKLASNALYEIDLSTLETFLFEKTRNIDLDEILDNQLNSKNLSTMTLEEIKKIISSLEKKSIWDRYFSNKIKIIDLEDNLSFIRIERNKVAHSKLYTKQDFDNDKQILCNFNTQFDKTIQYLDKEASFDSTDVLIALGKYLSDIKTMSIFIKGLVAFSNALNSIYLATKEHHPNDPKKSMIAMAQSFYNATEKNKIFEKNILEIQSALDKVSIQTNNTSTKTQQ